MRKQLGITISVIVAIGAPAACGGASSFGATPSTKGKPGVRALYAQLHADTKAQNFSDVCKLLDPSALAEASILGSCPALLAEAWAKRKHPPSPIQSIQLDGARATVRAKDGTTSKLLYLQGSWRIDGP